MSKITLEEVKSTVAADGWKVISTEYKNLKEQMEFECPEGHQVFAPYEKIRQKRECPICAQNKLRQGGTKAIPKKKDTVRVIGLDQATHISGYSVYDDRELIKVGTFSTKAEGEIERIAEVRSWVISLIETWHPDAIAIEGIQFQQTVDMGVTTFQTLARLQGVIMITCFEMGVFFEVCPTNTWRNHCQVKGRTRPDKKKSMQLLTKKWFDISVTEDEADAVGIGKYLAEKTPRGNKVKVVNWE